MQIDWRDILRKQVDKSGSIQAVADQLGYSRPAISLALKGNYKGSTDTIRAKVISTFCDRIVCPHTGESLAQADCQSTRTRPLSQSDPAAGRQWFACQYCPNNPDARSLSTARPTTKSTLEEHTNA